MRRVQQPQQGMALIEVLVGMAIMAIVLLSAMRAISSDTDTQQAVMVRSLALISAQNTMNSLYISQDWPNLGSETVTCPQLNFPLICEQKISSSANPNLRRVDIHVYLDDGSDVEHRVRLAWLSGLLANAERAL
jgi:general secretion pathway protein I